MAQPRRGLGANTRHGIETPASPRAPTARVDNAEHLEVEAGAVGGALLQVPAVRLHGQSEAVGVAVEGGAAQAGARLDAGAVVRVEIATRARVAADIASVGIRVDVLDYLYCHSGCWRCRYAGGNTPAGAS